LATQGGAVANGHLFGDVLAFGMTMCMAIMMLTTPFAVSMPNEANLFLFATTLLGLGMVFLAVDGQMVLGTESALINTLEMPLAVACRDTLLCGSSPRAPGE
jgi:hypothetical protein